MCPYVPVYSRDRDRLHEEASKLISIEDPDGNMSPEGKALRGCPECKHVDEAFSEKRRDEIWVKLVLRIAKARNLILKEDDVWDTRRRAKSAMRDFSHQIYITFPKEIRDLIFLNLHDSIIPYESPDFEVSLDRPPPKHIIDYYDNKGHAFETMANTDFYELLRPGYFDADLAQEYMELFYARAIFQFESVDFAIIPRFFETPEPVFGIRPATYVRNIHLKVYPYSPLCTPVQNNISSDQPSRNRPSPHIEILKKSLERVLPIISTRCRFQIQIHDDPPYTDDIVHLSSTLWKMQNRGNQITLWFQIFWFHHRKQPTIIASTEAEYGKILSDLAEEDYREHVRRKQKLEEDYDDLYD